MLELYWYIFQKLLNLGYESFGYLWRPGKGSLLGFLQRNYLHSLVGINYFLIVPYQFHMYGNSNKHASNFWLLALRIVNGPFFCHNSQISLQSIYSNHPSYCKITPRCPLLLPWLCSSLKNKCTWFSCAVLLLPWPCCKPPRYVPYKCTCVPYNCTFGASDQRSDARHVR